MREGAPLHPGPHGTGRRVAWLGLLGGWLARSARRSGQRVAAGGGICAAMVNWKRRGGQRHPPSKRHIGGGELSLTRLFGFMLGCRVLPNAAESRLTRMAAAMKLSVLAVGLATSALAAVPVRTQVLELD